MPNTNVFRGSDATLTLANEDTPEGQAAQEVIEFYSLKGVLIIVIDSVNICYAWCRHYGGNILTCESARV